MPVSERIYLDNAATSWPKPETVYDAVTHYLRHIGASAGRSAYREAVDAERIVDDTRRHVARLVGAADANSIIFTSNGTDGLNLALYGVLRPGDHVVTSVVEHNSMLRPLAELRKRQNVDVSYIRTDGSGLIEPDDIRAAIRPNTRLIALAHASNVTGAILPLAEVGLIAREHGVLSLVDAAQTLGHLPVDVARLHVDLLAGSGHKGLLGPLGTGILYIRPGVENDLASLRQGGTGTQSDEELQPDRPPEKYEVGNLNVPALAGLRAGAEYLNKQGIKARRQHELRVTDHLLGQLGQVDGVTLFGPRQAEQRVAVLSLNVAGSSPQEVATLLDCTYRIQVRAGLHCAPRMHRCLGTFDTGGTVRLSWGAFTTDEQIAAAVEAIREIAAQNAVPH